MPLRVYRPMARSGLCQESVTPAGVVGHPPVAGLIEDLDPGVGPARRRRSSVPAALSSVAGNASPGRCAARSRPRPNSAITGCAAEVQSASTARPIASPWPRATCSATASLIIRSTSLATAGRTVRRITRPHRPRPRPASAVAGRARAGPSRDRRSRWNRRPSCVRGPGCSFTADRTYPSPQSWPTGSTGGVKRVNSLMSRSRCSPAVAPNPAGSGAPNPGGGRTRQVGTSLAGALQRGEQRIPDRRGLGIAVHEDRGDQLPIPASATVGCKTDSTSASLRR